MDASRYEPYDPRLDRVDVAVRMLYHARKTHRGWKKYLEPLGLDFQAHNECMDEALLEVASLKREDDVMRVLERCPFLLDAAEEALRRYWEATAHSLGQRMGRRAA